MLLSNVAYAALGVTIRNLYVTDCRCPTMNCSRAFTAWTVFFRVWLSLFSGGFLAIIFQHFSAVRGVPGERVRTNKSIVRLQNPISNQVRILVVSLESRSSPRGFTKQNMSEIVEFATRFGIKQGVHDLHTAFHTRRGHSYTGKLKMNSHTRVDPVIFRGEGPLLIPKWWNLPPGVAPEIPLYWKK